jgi:hypothetical protein
MRKAGRQRECDGGADQGSGIELGRGTVQPGLRGPAGLPVAGSRLKVGVARRTVALVLIRH